MKYCVGYSCKEILDRDQVIESLHKELIVVCQKCGKVQRCGNTHRIYLCECGYWNQESEFVCFEPEQFYVALDALEEIKNTWATVNLHNGQKCAEAIVNIADITKEALRKLKGGA